VAALDAEKYLAELAPAVLAKATAVAA